MGKFKQAYLTVMARLWEEGSTLEEIADYLGEHHNIHVTRGALSYHANRNREMFPVRDQKWRNAAISRALTAKQEIDPEYLEQNRRAAAHARKAARNRGTDEPEAEEFEW